MNAKMLTNPVNCTDPKSIITKTFAYISPVDNKTAATISGPGTLTLSQDPTVAALTLTGTDVNGHSLLQCGDISLGIEVDGALTISTGAHVTAGTININKVGTGSTLEISGDGQLQTQSINASQGSTLQFTLGLTNNVLTTGTIGARTGATINLSQGNLSFVTGLMTLQQIGTFSPLPLITAAQKITLPGDNNSTGSSVGTKFSTNGISKNFVMSLSGSTTKALTLTGISDCSEVLPDMPGISENLVSGNTKSISGVCFKVPLVFDPGVSQSITSNGGAITVTGGAADMEATISAATSNTKGINLSLMAGAALIANAKSGKAAIDFTANTTSLSTQNLQGNTTSYIQIGNDELDNSYIQGDVLMNGTQSLFIYNPGQGIGTCANNQCFTPLDGNITGGLINVGVNGSITNGFDLNKNISNATLFLGGVGSYSQGAWSGGLTFEGGSQNSPQTITLTDANATGNGDRNQVSQNITWSQALLLSDSNLLINGNTHLTATTTADNNDAIDVDGSQLSNYGTTTATADHPNGIAIYLKNSTLNNFGNLITTGKYGVQLVRSVFNHKVNWSGAGNAPTSLYMDGSSTLNIAQTTTFNAAVSGNGNVNIGDGTTTTPLTQTVSWPEATSTNVAVYDHGTWTVPNGISSSIKTLVVQGQGILNNGGTITVNDNITPPTLSGTYTIVITDKTTYGQLNVPNSKSLDLSQTTLTVDASGLVPLALGTKLDCTVLTAPSAVITLPQNLPALAPRDNTTNYTLSFSGGVNGQPVVLTLTAPALPTQNSGGAHTADTTPATSHQQDVIQTLALAPTLNLSTLSTTVVTALTTIATAITDHNPAADEPHEAQILSVAANAIVNSSSTTQSSGPNVLSPEQATALTTFIAEKGVDDLIESINATATQHGSSTGANPVNNILTAPIQGDFSASGFLNFGKALARTKGKATAAGSSFVVDTQAELEDQGLQMWYKSLGSTENQEHIGQYRGYSTKTYGLTGGVTTTLAPKAKLSVSLAYNDSKALEKLDAVSSTNTKYWVLSTYGTYTSKNRWFVDGTALLGLNQNTVRRLDFSNTLYQKKVNSYTLGLGGRYGYNVKTKNKSLEISPFLAGQTSLTHTPTSVEGGGTLPITLKSNDQYSAQLGFGTSASYELVLNSDWRAIPEVTAQYMHEFYTKTRIVKATWLGQSIGIAMPTLGTEIFSLGANFNVKSREGMSIALDLNATLKNKYAGYTGFIKFSYAL